MFSITTIDLVRLDSEHVAQNYTVHARAAERLAAVAFTCRIVVVSLLAVVTAVAMVNVLSPARGYQLVTVAAAALALVAFAVYAVLGVESRVAAHRQIAHRVWLIAERYRALMAEMNDGALDVGSVMRRRDDLIHELHAVYEYGFAADQSAHETARLAMLPADRAA